MVQSTIRTFAQPDIAIEEHGGGVLELRSREPLPGYDSTLGGSLYRYAESSPHTPLVGERDDDSWRVLTYAEARDRAESVGEALLARGLGPDRSLVVLSGNSVDHLILTLGCYLANIPIVPASAAYTRHDGSYRRLREMLGLVRAGAVYAQDGDAYAEALAACADTTVGAGPPTLLASMGGSRVGCEPLDQLLDTTPTSRLAAARATVDERSVAKILLTSGSTGEPKAVPNTHGMLCAVQAMMRYAWPFLADTPVTLVDWLPWSHTFGGNHNLHMVLTTGGTMYIDDGGPTTHGFRRSLENLRGLSPNMHFNVPAGFAMLADELERDAEFAASFFADLQLLLSAGAPLPDVYRDRILAVARKVADHDVRFTSSWGMTETASAVTTAHLDTEDRQAIGVPLPGIRLRMVPADGKLEMRVAGPTVLPGYLDRPDLDALAFDEDGFFRTGDAGRLLDERNPSAGLAFDGRLAEEFKLVTGTWVRVGALRTALLDAVDELAEVVITGPGRPYVGALVWLRDGAEVSDLVTALRRFNADAGSSRRIARLLVLTTPADRDAGELSDKGTVNQRRVLQRRADLVDRLYQDPPPDDVIRLPDRPGRSDAPRR